MPNSNLFLKRRNVSLHILTEIESDDFFQINKYFLEIANYNLYYLINQNQDIKNNIYETKEFVDVLLIEIYSKIYDFNIKTLIYEINKLRLDKNLRGKNTEERYHDFIQFCTKNDCNYIKQKYPILNEIILKYVQGVINYIEEILTNFNKDKIVINEIINLEKITKLFFVGDNHENQRSTVILKLSNGKSIVYKPKDLTLEKNFNTLLKWINAKNELLKLKEMKFIVKDNYGWVEFIKNESCEDQNEIEDFYIRQGYYICLFDLLAGTDMHNGNVIAYKDFPVYFDLESIFSNVVTDNDQSIAYNKASEDLNKSIFSTNILPIKINNALLKDFSISPLVKSKGTIETYEIMNSKSDNIFLENKRSIYTEKMIYLPDINGEHYEYYDYKYQITEGYKKFSDLILKYKNELLESNILRLLFLEVKSRIIFKPTYWYSSVLKASMNPIYLTEESRRNEFFVRMFNAEKEKSILNKYEKSFLQNGEIPYFMYNAKRNKYETLYGDFESGSTISNYENVLRNIKNFNFSAIDKKLTLIKQSFKIDNLNNIYNEEILNIKVAEEIANYITDESIQTEDSIAWNNYFIDEYGEFTYTTLDIDLYRGQAGLLIFYSKLFEITRKEKYRKIIRKIINSISYKIVHESYSNTLYTGLIGVLISLNISYKVTKDKITKHLFDDLLIDIQKNIDKCFDIDVIDGYAGAILGFIYLFEETGNNSCLKLALEYGEKLLYKLKNEDKNLDYTYAHGLSGIIHSLIKIYELTKQSEFKNIAIQLYSSIEKYADNIINQTNKDISINWCNGLLGIIIIVNKMKDYKSNSILNVDQLVSLINIDEIDFYYNSCLCHGYIGILDVLNSINTPESNKKVDALKNQIKNKMKNNLNFWENTSNNLVPVFGLMQGITGFALGLLLIDKEISILNLDSKLVSNKKK